MLNYSNCILTFLFIFLRFVNCFFFSFLFSIRNNYKWIFTLLFGSLRFILFLFNLLFSIRDYDERIFTLLFGCLRFILFFFSLLLSIRNDDKRIVTLLFGFLRLVLFFFFFWFFERRICSFRSFTNVGI